MIWVVGSVLGVLLETMLIIALARQATSQYEQELIAAPADETDLVRLRRLPARRTGGEMAPAAGAPA